MTDPVDPVEKRNLDDERQVLALAQLDAGLNDHQQRLDQLAHDDPVGLVWAQELGRDDWIDRRLPPQQ